MASNPRNRYMWRILALLALAALLIMVLIRSTKGEFAVFGWYDDSSVETVLDERFDIDGVRQVNLDVGALTVEVVSTQEEQVRVVFQSNLPRDRRAELAVERDGDTFTVEQLSRVRIGLFLNVREKVTLYLPAVYQDALSLRLRSGNLSLTGTRAFSDLSVSLTSGNMEIGDITADTYAVHASSGNVTLGNWVGEGRVQVTSGNIRALSLSGGGHEIKSTSGTVRIGSLSGESILHVTSGTIRVERFEGSGKFSSTSGSVNAGIARITGDLALSCVSGTIRVTVPQSASFRFDAETLSGSVKTDFPSTRDGRRTTATVGSDPVYTLRCDTTSGSIKVGY